MLIIPFASKMTLKPLPWVTLCLIVINCFVLFFMQSGENEQYQKAVENYADSVLPELEIPAYARFLEEGGRIKEAKRLRKKDPKQIARSSFPILLQRDAAFIAQLHQLRWVTPEDHRFNDWKQAREKFESALSGIVTEEYSFKPDQPEIVDMFTHMFLHGGFDHLLGNMVFLFLLGFVVERLIGPFLYASIYIVGGLCAVASFAMVSAGSGTSLVGASGAIGGLMGIYVVLFGWRKIPFFYSVGFYFDYVKAPALLLLFAFLSKELYFHYYSDSNVAYMAHFGGIVAGAICGIVLTRLIPVPVDDMLAELERSEKKHIKPWQTEFDMAMGYVEKLQYKKAGDIFAVLCAKYPDEHILLYEWYKVERNSPSGENYHIAARRLMLRKGNQADSVQSLHAIYKEYMETAQPKPRIDRELAMSLVSSFSERGELEDAEKLLRLLLKNAPSDIKLASLVLLVARKLRMAKMEDRAVPYLRWVYKNADELSLRKQAQSLLKA